MHTGSVSAAFYCHPSVKQSSCTTLKTTKPELLKTSYMLGLLALINMSDSQDLSFLKSQNFDLDTAVSGTTPTAGTGSAS